MLNITDVRIRIISSERAKSLKAVATITIDECFVVHDIKVLDGEKGLFMAMPRRPLPSGYFKDVAHPLNTETRNQIEAIILKAYEEELQKEPEQKEE